MELIQNQDYRIQGYMKKNVYGTNGDLITVEYYGQYDSQTQTYSNLIVKEIKTIERDINFGIPFQENIEIVWYKSDGSVIAQKNILKVIDINDGQKINQNSRTNLTTKAQGYLIQTVGLANTKELGVDISSERSAYISGATQALIDAVNNSSRTYMTAEVKASVVAILNVTF